MKHTVAVARILLSLVPISVLADGNSVDKVYHPYVYPEEREIEFRTIIQNDANSELDNQSVSRLGLGKSVSDTLFIEGYLIGNKNRTDDFDLDAMEIEGKLQLTEQGEYTADWGLLLEFEKGFSNNLNELSVSILSEKEFGRLIGTVNLAMDFEWGGDLNKNNGNDLENRLLSQLRYRYTAAFEPAVEFYSGQDSTAIGPVVMGQIRLGSGRKLHWEGGLLLGMDNRSPDQTWRFLVEYEF